ncbi:MAG: OmpA family protein, partial [Lautropia sp.]
EAQSAYAQARSDTARAELSAAELDQANAALKRAERAWQADDDRAEVDHLAILAERRVQLATAAAKRKETEMAIDRAGRERDAIQLGASRRQVDTAQAQATTSQMQAADLASRNAALEAAAVEQRQRAEALAARLRDLQAKETERGLVVTFSDVLFDTGRAELKAGALARIGQLADVMKEYPERNVLIEGFTDSTGSEATNQQLSERRAFSVRQELVARGIAPRRVVTRGHAERYPVADNSTAAGRQQNRRVEAVLSDAKGELPMRP